jgi:hypothetical protein
MRLDVLKNRIAKGVVYAALSDECSKKGMEPAGVAQAASRGNLFQNEGQRGGRRREGRKYNCLLN